MSQPEYRLDSLKVLFRTRMAQLSQANQQLATLRESHESVTASKKRLRECLLEMIQSHAVIARRKEALEAENRDLVAQNQALVAENMALLAENQVLVSKNQDRIQQNQACGEFDGLDFM